MKDSTRAHTRYARWLAALLTAAVALISAPALAGTPIQVPVQGLLTDSDGQAIDGQTQVTFRIYPDASSSQVVWESEVSLSVDMGLFETALGAADELDSDLFSGHPDAHLSINIAGDDESARMPLGTVPTAAHAITADSAEEAHTLQGQTPEDLVGDISAGDVAFDDSQAQLGADNSQAALEALLARVEALEQDKQAMQTQIDDNESTVASLDTRVSDVETDTSGIQSQITANETRSQDNETQLQSLESTVTSNSSDIATLQSSVSANTNDISSLQTSVSSNSSDISSLQSTTSANSSDISSLQSTTSTNSSDISSLQAKTANMSADTINGKDAITFDGVNVYVRNGSGSTSGTVDGTGNLIVGYDESNYNSDKSGSHNLVLGNNHTYTSYGGIVAGSNNEITGTYASVLGGSSNIASDTTAVVISGFDNTASGRRSAVIAGWGNTASGSYSAVLAGDGNETISNESGIGGGTSVTNNSMSNFSAEGTITAP